MPASCIFGEGRTERALVSVAEDLLTAKPVTAAATPWLNHLGNRVANLYMCIYIYIYVCVYACRIMCLCIYIYTYIEG